MARAHTALSKSCRHPGPRARPGLLPCGLIGGLLICLLSGPGLSVASPLQPKGADMEKMLQNVRQRQTDPGTLPPLPESLGPEGTADKDGLALPHGPLAPPAADPATAPDAAAAPAPGQGQGTASGDKAGPAPDSPPLSGSFRAPISTAGHSGLQLTDNILTLTTDAGNPLAIPARPVLGSPDLTYVYIPPVSDAPRSVRHGLYLFDATGAKTAFLPELGVPDCPAVYLSPDRGLLAVDLGGVVNHRLELYSWPGLLPQEVRLYYAPGEDILIGAQKKELARRAEAARAAAEAQAAAEAEAAAAQDGKKQAAKQDRRKASRKEDKKGGQDKKDARKAKFALRFEPLVWYGQRGLVYRLLDTDTARPCGYEPCGVISVRAWDPASGQERVLCAGTELCDCLLFDIDTRQDVPVAQVGMQCTESISDWKSRDNKKTSLSIQVPLR